MKKVLWLIKVIFAANALVFALLLFLFLIVMFLFGTEKADIVWTRPWSYILAWIISLPICFRFLDKKT